MAKTIYSEPYQVVVAVLADARRAAGLKQAELAAKIGKDQSFISLMENARRRIDVVEFFVLAQALGRNPTDLIDEIARKMPSSIEAQSSYRRMQRTPV